MSFRGRENDTFLDDRPLDFSVIKIILIVNINSKNVSFDYFLKLKNKFFKIKLILFKNNQKKISKNLEFF
jgi:hypothetical protein